VRAGLAVKWLAAITLALLAIAPARAQDGAERARDQEIARAARQIERLSAEVGASGAFDPAGLESELRAAMARMRAPLDKTVDELRHAEENLALLGAPPKEGEPAEAVTVAAEREKLNARISFLRGQRTRIFAGVEQAERALRDLSGRRLADRYRALLRRGPPLFEPAQWRAAGAEASALASAGRAHLASWAEGRRDAGGVTFNLAGLIVAIAASIMLFGPFRAWLRRQYSARLEAHEPTPGRRVAAAGVAMLSRVIPGLVGGLAVIETARFVGLITPSGEPVARAAWIALIAYLVVDGFASGLFKPVSSAWRVGGFDFTKTRAASALLLAIVFIVGAKSVIVAMAATQAEQQALMRIAPGLAAVFVGGLFFLLCEKRLWAPGAATGAPERRGLPDVLRFMGRLLALFIIAAAIAGHVNLANFLATRVYYAALILAVAWFLRAALREGAAWADRRLKSGRSGETPPEDAGAFMFWVGAGIDIVILLVIAPALLLLAGFDAMAARTIFLKAFAGFRIGDVVISFSDIFFAVVGFIAVLAATRALQGALQRGPLAHTRMDEGVRQSLVTLFGYAGLIVAALVGVSALGFDLSNLAIIAGALSVGVGFGLQGVVNNFVSGLILLFERPVKTGDWIVTASGEGIVRRIGVRSTEIETFERASIIIPNSELVASTVTNWTHKNAIGRVSVAVGVAYRSDPEKVRDVLLDCARAHAKILAHPAPFVVWRDFGPSALDFELRGFVRDIADGLQVRTDLRFAIFKAFREAGIEIPFPQQDIHIKSVAATAARDQGGARGRGGGRAPIHEPDEVDAPED
jgi:small-conductance mechanosensitive channel